MIRFVDRFFLRNTTVRNVVYGVDYEVAVSRESGCEPKQNRLRDPYGSGFVE